MGFKNYTELLLDYPNGKLPYNILLETNEWRQKREKIRDRENNICQVCKNRCMDDFILEARGNFVINVPAEIDEIIEQDSLGRMSLRLALVPMENPRIPHVHHTYYLLGNLPWEYPENDLMFVCHLCHANIHETQKINVYRNNKKFELCEFTPCLRCRGIGYLKEFDYYQGGVCFRCKGSCFEEWK